MLSDEARSPLFPATMTIRGAARMAYRDELMYELWRAPKVLTWACVAPFGAFILWGVVLFVANLPMSWDHAIQQPGVTAQEFFRFVSYYALSWLPFSLPLFFMVRQLSWLRYRFGAGRRGITYEISESGIMSTYDKGLAITIPWAMTTRLVSTRRLLLLRYGCCSWWYLPWRALNTADQERLWSLVQEHVATAKRGQAGSA
jgi:uncharacterized membrane protein